MSSSTASDEHQLIDPSLLANLSEAEKSEALAAAAAAKRAELRAEQRAKERAAKLEYEQQQSAAAANGGGGLTPEEEEARALAEAQAARRRERERERELEKQQGGKVAAATSLLGGAAVGAGERGNGLVFVSKKKRGADQMSTGENGSSAAAGVASSKASAKRTEGTSTTTKGQAQESHLSASQLASIKRAYLGEKALELEPSSSNAAANQNNSRYADSSQSVRQRLREQRQKRRVKKTTFKFEWGNEEDTFEDDDPLYGVVSSSTNSNIKSRGRQDGRGIRPPGRTPADAVGGASFGKRKNKSNYDQVTSVATVANKPLEKMTARDWRIFRENYDIVVKGGKSPPPLRSFRETPLGVPSIHPKLLDAIENTLKYTKPSPIQRQAIPIGMQRRDLIGIAETGSGKTAAFGIPLCHHILSFPQSILDTVAEEGPLALVMAPTRELALQIDIEIRKLLSSQQNVVSLAVVGGQSITEQATKLRNGVHVVVGTPGRINDCVEMAYLVLNQCSYIVLDEADRMIDLGFAPQIEQILDAMGGKLKSENETEAYEQERKDLEILGKAVPSHRLTAMFSATMPSEVERIAKRYLRHPVIVQIGDQDSGKNARITQRVLYLSSSKQKESTLRDILRRSRSDEKIIVFVNEKKHADGVGRMVENAGRRCVVLHGGKTQEQREENLGLFRRGGVVLVATDVAGRGLDIPDVHQVINFDLPTRSIDNYCHRIGRTGRAGKEGLATSFITDEDEGIMAQLKTYLESTNSDIPDKLARHPAASAGGGEGYIR
mmetsp:Transcript_17386/g.37637  ORF Transcript_17386/g.37637 Transcript_17386/m.37637 type:complete len:779 (-) Transcript_17386:62-2398(-)